MMLRITAGDSEGGLVRYKLEGRLSGQYIDELERIVGAAMKSSPRVALDLSGLTFVDAPGAELLRELLSHNVEVQGCSGFVGHLIGLP